ncbi:MAG: AAA family ATPase [Chloroflexi bacterium]|nr:AAA family ATPase [Chloroflexota bacterium]
MTLRIHLFGQPRFDDGEKSFKFSAPPKTLPLWSFLLLNIAQPVERETVAFALWTDEPETVARANLRRHLHYLRRALPRAPQSVPWLLIDAETVQWNPQADFWLDTAEFEKLCNIPDQRAAAVALYAGDLLANVYDDWIVYARERFRNLYFAALHQLVLSHRARGEHPQAIAYANQLLAADPLREDTLRQLITLRYQAGDRAGALDEYARFVRRLGTELSVEPMPETVALYEAVVRNTRLPGTAPTSEVTPNEKTIPFALPFVGREADVERLRVAWSRAAQGQGSIVLIGGEAGIGKTRLATELAQFVETQGARVLWGDTAFAEPMPYQAVIAALASVLALLAALEINPIWLSAIVPLIPALATRRADLAKLSPLDPDRERARLFEALARCFEGLAQPRPILLILEDLHWAGAATLAWLEFFARRVSSHRVLVLLTYRDEEITRAHPWRDLRRRLETENQVAQCALTRLSATDVENLLAQFATDSTPPGNDLARDLYAASGGNPLFLTELIRDLDDAHPTTLGDMIPKHVQTTIASRVARLSESARMFAGIAAVIGSAFDIELARVACGWDEHQALDAVDELLDQHLIREAGGHGRFDYAFTHSLHQAAIYADTPEAARRRRHHRVARVMEELYADRLDDLASQLALHLERAGETRRAAEYSLRVARRAQMIYADQDALEHIAHALELDPDQRTRFDLVRLRETIHSRRGERDAQRIDLEQLAQSALALNDDDAECEVLRRQILFLRALGERQDEAAAIDALTTRAFARDAKCWQAEAIQAQAAHQVLIGEYDAAHASLEHALVLHRELDDANNQVQCFCLLAEVAIHRGQWSRVQPLLDQATALAEARGNYALLIQTWRTTSGVLFARQDFDAAARLANQMLERCRAMGDREGEADAHARLGAIAARQFQIQSAREHYDQARKLYAALEKRQGLAAVMINRAVLASRLGHYAESLDAYAQAEKLFHALNDLRGQVVSALNLSIVNLFQGDYAAAKSAAQRGLELARAMNAAVMEANALANLGAAERDLGELPDALAHMQAGLAIRRQLGQPAELGTDLCDLTVAYLRAGDLGAARASTDEMLALYASAAETMMHPQYILWAAAQTYRALGNGKRARELLEQAYRVLEDKAAAIPDAESRATFFHLPFNRELREASSTKTRRV